MVLLEMELSGGGGGAARPFLFLISDIFPFDTLKAGLATGSP